MHFTPMTQVIGVFAVNPHQVTHTTRSHEERHELRVLHHACLCAVPLDR